MERARNFCRSFQNSTFGKTVAETVVFITAEYLIEPWIQKTKIPVSTGKTEEDYKWDAQNMHIIVPYGTLAAPVIEETLFRFIPSILTDKKKPSWKVGIAFSLAFALAHNLNIDRYGNITMETKKFPLYEFASGILLWHITKSHGIRNAIVSHSVINSASFALEAIQERIRLKSET